MDKAHEAIPLYTLEHDKQELLNDILARLSTFQFQDGYEYTIILPIGYKPLCDAETINGYPVKFEGCKMKINGIKLVNSE